MTFTAKTDLILLTTQEKEKKTANPNRKSKPSPNFRNYMI